MGPATTGSVGEILREWRALRGASQLDLALAAEVSTRHVSFVENGRSRPSRAMVLRLSEALDLPLRDRNALLLAAGHAPHYGHASLDAEEHAPIRRALETVLESHEPYPAFVLDRAWNVLFANDAHHLLLERLLPTGADPGDPVNVLRLVLDPALLRPHVGNWDEVAHVLGHRVKRHLRLPGLDLEERARLEGLLAVPGVREAMARVRTSPAAEVVLPLQLQLEGERLSWFSTIATLGTPQDVTLQELSIESLFPADERTRELVAELVTRGDARARRGSARQERRR